MYIFNNRHSCVHSHIFAHVRERVLTAGKLQDLKLLNKTAILFFSAQCLTLTCTQRKCFQMSIPPPLGLLLLTLFMSMGGFFLKQHKHPNMFSALLQWQTHCGEYLLGISARPCTTPTSHPQLSNVTAVSQRLWCSTVEECTQMHHKQCKTETLINKVNSVQE